MFGSKRQGPVVIVVGSGKTGRRVDALLRARGFATRPVSRSTIPSFDWTRTDTWDEALSGASAAYITFQPDLAAPGASEAIAEFVGRARENGVKRLVLLSGRGEEGAKRAEDVLRRSGLSWTIVRASWFSQNFSENFFVESLRAGELALPAGSVAEPFVDADDIAEVVVAALTDKRHANRLYEVTGPEAITFEQAVAVIARETGRPLRFVPIEPEAFAGALREVQTPPEMISLLMELFTVVLDGRNSRVANGVQQALGRSPRSFQHYARAAAATGVWSERGRTSSSAG